MNNSAGLCKAQGKYDLAEACIPGRLGFSSSDTCTSMDNLVGFYERKGIYDLAEPIYESAMAPRRRMLGDDHPPTCASINNLAELYQAE